MNLAASTDAPAAGVLIFDRARTLSAWTEGACAWRDSVDALLGELDGALEATASTSFRADGRWVAAQAMRLEGGGIVVTVAPMPADEVVDSVASRYGLTGREREIVELLAHGLDTRGVTQTLSISRYTLQDHLKSIFRKTGVHTRLKLVALVSAAQSARLTGF